MRRKELQINGSRVSYFEEGTGEPVVLLHGFCGSALYWEKIVPLLSKDYRVIAIDLPGHGQSENLPGSSSIKKIAAHIRDFLVQAGVKKSAMFGHSMGGYVTLSFAEQFPEMLKGFSLVHSTAHPDSEEAKRARSINAGKIESEGLNPFIDGLVPKLFAETFSGRNEKAVERAKDIGYSTSKEGAIVSLLAMKDRPDFNHVLEQASMPILLIAGKLDGVVPPEKTFSVDKPHVRKGLIEDAGHMGMYESPDELAGQMKAFLESL